MKKSKAEEVALANLGTFSRERRHHLEMRQQDLADRSGLSPAWIGMLEAHRLRSWPLKDSIQKLVQGLKIAEERPGNLYSFLDLVLAGRVGVRAVRQVASCRRTLDEVLKEILDGKGIELAPDADEMATALFLDRDMRSRRFETVLAMLKEDLSEDDYVLASLLIKRLYEEPVQRKPVSPRSAPRRSRNS